jgi:predicted O-methyltransferase YrrM
MIDSGAWADLWTDLQAIDGHYSVTEEQAFLLWRAAQSIPPGGVIVELGVCHGRMARLLARVAAEKAGSYLGIDDWSLEGSMAAVAAHLDAFPLQHWTLIEGKTQEVPPSHSNLLFIDAGHDEANIKPDCERWIPYLTPGGLVAFHDYNPTEEPPSCHWAVRHYADRHTGDWPLIGYWGGLLIRRRPV